MAQPVNIRFHDKRWSRFRMIECEIQFDGDIKTILGKLNERDYYDAYDADEDCTFFRADAMFRYYGSSNTDKKEYCVPVFPARMKKNESQVKWYVRFSPPLSGLWSFEIRLLAWTESTLVGKQELKVRKTDRRVYSEYRFGYAPEDYATCPDAKRRFTVIDDLKYKYSGPLQVPRPKDKENPNYFYREIFDTKEKKYKRQPYFLLGLARPWVSAASTGKDNPWGPYTYLDRKEELFDMMSCFGDPKNAKKRKMGGCNALLHWMAPWESLLVHQSSHECWPTGEGKFAESPLQMLMPKQSLPKAIPLQGEDKELAYRCYDQGRALLTDNIFRLAQNAKTLIFLVVMPHALLRDENHNWGGGRFRETGNSKDDPHPSQVNGFKLFNKDKNKNDSLSIQDFFSMCPGDGISWQTQLWKHYANFWRYIIARWGAFPSLGAWIVVDEMDGTGTGSTGRWWWDNARITYPWHENVVKLIKSELVWGVGPTGVLHYTGDYLHHPLSSSSTDYEGTKLVNKRVEEKSPADALGKLRGFPEKPDHGIWTGKAKGKWNGEADEVDFLSHHAYQVVPTYSEGKPDVWQKVDNSFEQDENGKKYPSDKRRRLIKRIKADTLLFESLWSRLYNWSMEAREKQHKLPMLITEFGAIERAFPSDDCSNFGKRYPSYAHFAYWAALMLGHAGIPFKWNDGKELGEMMWRTQRQSDQESNTANPSNPWHPKRYPINNYTEMYSIAAFLRDIDLQGYRPLQESRISVVTSVGESNAESKTRLKVWALSSQIEAQKSAKLTALIAWIYDPLFKGSFSQSSNDIRLNVQAGLSKCSYKWRWYNTWSGEFSNWSGPGNSSETGIIQLTIPPFPLAGNRRDKVSIAGIGEGNDIAVQVVIK